MLGKLKLFVITTVFVFLLIGSGLVICPEPQASELRSATIVWGEEQLAGNQLFYSVYNDGRWSKSKQLTSSDAYNYMPTLAGGSNTLVVWAATEDKQTKLFYALLNRDEIIQPPKQIKTGFSSNVAPVLSLNSEGIPILVWSGNNGNLDDIYMTKYSGGAWQTPVRIHPQNKVPDFLPVMNMNSTGELIVEWTTFGNNGPVQITKNISSGVLNSTNVTTHFQEMKKTRQSASACMTQLPLQARDNPLLSVLFVCEEEAARHIRYFKGN